MSAIEVKDATVDLPVYNSTGRSFKHALLTSGKLGGAIGRDRRDRTVVRALQDINLTLREGDRIGLIGRNGAGKSTLLRVLAGIYPPTAGHVSIDGRVSTLFNLTAMIDPEMTGYENIEYACIFLGVPRSGQRDFIQDIEEFTELGEFLRMPVRTYSAGMQVRLAFALMTAQDSDILLLDEAIGAGDAHFVGKALHRVYTLCQRANILVLASHSEAHLRSVCNRLLWLENGAIRRFGAFEDVLAEYRNNVY